MPVDRRVFVTALILLGCSSAPASAQTVVVPAAPQIVYTQPGYVQAAPVRSRGSVLPGFSRRGGIGTTPFLGNRYGMGVYGYNYDTRFRRGWGWRRWR